MIHPFSTKPFLRTASARSGLTLGEFFTAAGLWAGFVLRSARACARAHSWCRKYGTTVASSNSQSGRPSSCQRLLQTCNYHDKNHNNSCIPSSSHRQSQPGFKEEPSRQEKHCICPVPKRAGKHAILWCMIFGKRSTLTSRLTNIRCMLEMGCMPSHLKPARLHKSIGQSKLAADYMNTANLKILQCSFTSRTRHRACCMI